VGVGVCVGVFVTDGVAVAVSVDVCDGVGVLPAGTVEVRVGVGLGVAVGTVGVRVAVGVVVAVGVGESTGTTGTTVTVESIRSTSSVKAALTRRSISPGMGSFTVKTNVDVPSPATASPFVPSSRMVPSIATTWPILSTRSSSTLPAISAGSPGPVVIWLVAVRTVSTPT
jgi:hypothetical protein